MFGGVSVFAGVLVLDEEEPDLDIVKDEDFEQNLLAAAVMFTGLEASNKQDVISEEDNLPKVICSSCTVRLKVAHKFIQTAHESESNLKKFLAKISNEFKEVTQSSKPDQTKNNNDPSSDQNLTEDEMQALIREDEIPVSSNSASQKSNECEKAKVKRKTSPLKAPSSKIAKREYKTEDKERGDLKLTQTSQQAAKVTKHESQKDVKSSYALSDDILLIHTEKYDVEFENETHFMEDEDQQGEDEKVEEDVHGHVNRQEGEVEEDVELDLNQEQEDAINDDIPDSFEIQDLEEADVGNHDTLEDHDQDVGIHDPQDTLKDQEQEDDQNQDTQELTINEEVAQTELSELTLDENQLHQSLEENPPDIENIVAGQQDGYLREYETMLNNQVTELQYHTDYIEENSVDENPIKDDIIYTQKLEDVEEIYDVDATEDVIKYEDPIEMPYQETSTEQQRDKVMAKTTTRKESHPKHNRFYCEQCNRDFSTKTNLNRHMLSHEGNKPHVCPQCSKSFSQKSTLKQHMYTHTGERPYVCEVCTRGFTQCKSLIFHMRRHTGEKPFQCEYCLIMFRQKDALRAKNYAIVGDDMSFFQPCDPKDNDGNTNFGDLAELHLTHDYADDLDTIITNGNITINVDLSPDETIMADMEIYEWKRGEWVNTIYSMNLPNLCASVFDPNEFWFPLIMQFPEEERVCPPKKNIHILKYHVIIEQLSNGKEIYICIICQKKFNAKSDFKIHMKIHTATTEPDSNEFITDETMEQPRAHTSSHGRLSSMLRDQENLDAAVMNVSASSASEPRRAKKYQCRKCFKCFALKKSLIRHMSIHYTNTEEDITECSDCDLQFANVDEYQEHLSERHQFACSACPQLIFKTIQDLKLHMFEHDLDQQEEAQEQLV